VQPKRAGQSPSFLFFFHNANPLFSVTFTSRDEERDPFVGAWYVAKARVQASLLVPRSVCRSLSAICPAARSASKVAFSSLFRPYWSLVRPYDSTVFFPVVVGWGEQLVSRRSNVSRPPFRVAVTLETRALYRRTRRRVKGRESDADAHPGSEESVPLLAEGNGVQKMD